MDIYRKTIGRIISYFISDETLERLVVSPILKKGLSPGTIERSLGVFSAVWNDARRLGIVSGRNPKTKVARPRRDSARERFLSRDEASRLLEALKERSMLVHDPALLSLFTGMRFGECRSLTWADVDLENGLIFVKNTKSHRNRHAHITAEVREMLRHRLAEKSLTGNVFDTPAGGKFYAFQSHHFKMTVRELKFNEGITDPRQMVCFHSLRQGMQ